MTKVSRRGVRCMSEIAFNALEKKVKKIKVEGFTIYKGSTQIFEYLKNKKVVQNPTKVYSVTKSIISILIGIMVDKGLIKNIHEPIHHYFPEILEFKDPKKEEITLFHLLTMTSGLQVGKYQSSKNWIKFILEQPVIHEPGTTFEYNNGNSHLLSAIIQKVSGRSTASFAEEFLFHPLGIKKYIWVKDPQGIYEGGFSLSLNLADMVNFGFLLLNEGQFKSKQVVSSHWIHEARKPYKQFEPAEERTFGYGYQLWNCEIAMSNNKIEYYYARGLYGQFIFIVPKLNIMAVAKSYLQEGQSSAPLHFFEDFLRSWMTE